MDAAIFVTPGFIDRSLKLLEAGGNGMAFHLRAGEASGAAIYAALERLAERARETGSLVLVNDRVDVALAGGAHGVQLGQGSLPVAAARAILGPGAIIGASVRDAGSGAAAAAQGADFLLCGTLFPSGSHPGRPAAGVGWLTGAAGAGVAVIGIGGITPERVPEVLAAGAHGVAVIRAVWEQPEPVRALKRFRAVIEGCVG